jgi:DNA-binding response OmpR family regulator
MASTNEILIIDGDPATRTALAPALRKDGYPVTLTRSRQSAIQRLQTGGLALVVLCLDLQAGMDPTLIEEAHRFCPQAPVLLMTTATDSQILMEALRKGAYDYLVKPIDPGYLVSRVGQLLDRERNYQRRREILAQMRSLLAELKQLNQQKLLSIEILSLHAELAERKKLECGPFSIDKDTRQASFNERQLSLSPAAFDYLLTLVRHSPHPVSYEALVREAQDYHVSRQEARELVHWHVHELRRAIELVDNTHRYIITVRDVGYMLVP